jgi:hypothetical protein
VDPARGQHDLPGLPRRHPGEQHVAAVSQKPHISPHTVAVSVHATGPRSTGCRTRSAACSSKGLQRDQHAQGARGTSPRR